MILPNVRWRASACADRRIPLLRLGRVLIGLRISSQMGAE